MVNQCSEQLQNATYLFTTSRYSGDNTISIDCTNPVPKPLLSQIEEENQFKFIFHLFLKHDNLKAYFTSTLHLVWISHKLVAILYDEMQQLSKTYEAHSNWPNPTFTLFIVRKCILMTINLNTILAIFYIRSNVKKK